MTSDRNIRSSAGDGPGRRLSLRRRGIRRGAATLAVGTLAGAAALALATPAGAYVLPGGADLPPASGVPLVALPVPAPDYAFSTLNNDNDLTFNQLLGINDQFVIAGYFGSGAKGHPNKGYQLLPPYKQGNYVNENFPGSVQTQVTGLNDNGVTVGFWAPSNNANGVNANFGFYAEHGRFHEVNFPTSHNSKPPVNQLLGVDDSGVAVGFYTDNNGNNHGYEFNIFTHQFTRVTISGAVSLTAAGINKFGDVTGFYTSAQGATKGFLIEGDHVIRLSVPGAASTTALGVNDKEEVVGVYVPGDNPNALDGFTWTPHGGFTTVNDPNGVGTTTINGVNDFGDLVGFYVDGNGNTDGMLAIPH
jgi:hypothetical protein